LPYLQRVFGGLDVPVRFFHNDAQGRVCAKFLSEIGVNLFNFSFEHSLAQMRAWTGPGVTLVGNIPPRDVLAQGTPADVAARVAAAIKPLSDRSRIILSCGGGMPPGVPSENVLAVLSSRTR
jgi:uroporphyrinogen-III decarboxylase